MFMSISVFLLSGLCVLRLIHTAFSAMVGFVALALCHMSSSGISSPLWT